MALQPACKVELEQHDMDVPRRHAGRADHLVDIDGARLERAHDQLALALPDVWQGLRGAMRV